MDRYSYETAGKRMWRKLEPEVKRMRQQPTPAEDALWRRIRGGKLRVRFRRQHAIDRFVVDFVCLPAKLVVEVDGGIHESQAERDQERDALLESAGYQVIRYSNEQVLGDIEAVLEDIRKRLGLRSRVPSPLERGVTPSA